MGACDGEFTVDMTTIRSDQSRRDNQFNGRIMNVSQFPTSTFTLTVIATTAGRGRAAAART